jgi:hypothetical protein
MTFEKAAQFSLHCFLTEAEEAVHDLERDMQPFIADE